MVSICKVFRHKIYQCVALWREIINSNDVGLTKGMSKQTNRSNSAYDCWFLQGD